MIVFLVDQTWSSTMNPPKTSLHRQTSLNNSVPKQTFRRTQRWSWIFQGSPLAAGSASNSRVGNRIGKTHFFGSPFFFRSWWLWFQPIRKICASQIWIISPRYGVNIKNLWNHHLYKLGGCCWGIMENGWNNHNPPWTSFLWVIGGSWKRFSDNHHPQMESCVIGKSRVHPERLTWNLRIHPWKVVFAMVLFFSCMIAFVVGMFFFFWGGGVWW